MTSRHREPAPRRILRRGARADVLEVSEPVEELAADEVEITVPIEVREVRRRPAEGFQRLVADHDAERLLVAAEVRRRIRNFRFPISDFRVRLLTSAATGYPPRHIHEPAQRPVGPLAARVVSIVPDVFRPVADPDYQVLRAVAVVVRHAPHIRADLVRVDVRGQGELHRFVEAGLEEVRVCVARREHHGFPVHVADLHILQSLADATARLEHRQLVLRGVARDVLEEVNAVVRLVRAVHDEVQVAIAIEVHRQRPRP